MGNIFHKRESRKTGIINYNRSELSTGNEILNRFREAAFIAERTDPSYKRTKPVKHTAKGEKMLFECYRRLHPIGSLLFNELAEENKKLCLFSYPASKLIYSGL